MDRACTCATRCCCCCLRADSILLAAARVFSPLHRGRGTELYGRRLMRAICAEWFQEMEIERARVRVGIASRAADDWVICRGFRFALRDWLGFEIGNEVARVDDYMKFRCILRTRYADYR